jgi:hypothetical protein
MDKLGKIFGSFHAKLLILLIVTLFLLTGCGGGNNGNSPTTYTVSGTVTGNVNQGVTISLSGTSAVTTTTDSNGDFSFTNLANGSYTLTPSLSGCTFVPDSLSLTMNISNISAQFIAYKWYIYNGHSYTLTSDWSDWIDAEDEAISIGGHLVTINDADENAWLIETFKDTYDAQGAIPNQNIAWIGYNDEDNDSTWTWTGGTSSYTNLTPEWGTFTGLYAYLLLGNYATDAGYTSWRGTWGHNDYHYTHTDYYAKGVIERDLVIFGN